MTDLSTAPQPSADTAGSSTFLPTGLQTPVRHANPATGTVLDAIGNTPLVRVDGIWVKLEYLNPSGSIKARLAAYMIDRAEREGLLRPGDTIVEASSGNTGNALSMVAAVKGYRMIVVMPAGLSSERAAISRAFGAEVLTIGDFHVNEALGIARELGARPGYFAPQQFDSEWNVEENDDLVIFSGSISAAIPTASCSSSRAPRPSRGSGNGWRGSSAHSAGPTSQWYWRK
jgi:hypothetical protein